jgi:hypothetical protein
MAAGPVAIDYSPSLRSIAGLKIGLAPEPGDEKIGIGLDQKGSFFSGMEPIE